MKKIEAGQVYGRLTVIQNLVRAAKNTRWLCLCECGNKTSVWGSGLRNNLEPTRSCGCLQNESALRPPGQTAYTVIFTRYKKNAQIREIKFLLSKKDVFKLIQLNCYYCGEAPKLFNPYMKANGVKQAIRSQNSVDRAWVKVNEIDRLENDKGYTIANCVPCCAVCNYAKLDYSKREYLDHCLKVVSYQLKIAKEDK